MRKALLTGIVLLVFPAAASADRRTHMQPTAETAFPQPCEVEVADPPTTWKGASLLGMDLPGCKVGVRSGLSRKDTCLVMVHEYGHNAGLAHTNHPHSIMYPDPTIVPYQPCLYFERLEIRLEEMRMDLAEARYDRRRRTIRRLSKKIRQAKRALGP